MGLFVNPRKNREKWAEIVMPNVNVGATMDEKKLDEATDLYIKQHARILYESIHLVVTSKKKNTQKSRYKLAEQHLGSLCKVRKYGTKGQKQAIDQAFKDFRIMEEQYKHPYKQAHMQKSFQKNQKKNDFWETYAELEMLDIFSGADD